MPNKNKQDQSSTRLIDLNTLHGKTEKQALRFDICDCIICKMRSSSSEEIFQPIEKDENSLVIFIKQFPSIFPLHIVPTTGFDSQKDTYVHYSNGNRNQNKSFIFRTKTSKLVTNFPLASNIHIFGSNFSKITAKFQIPSILRNFQQKKQNQHKKPQSQKKMTSSVILPPVSDNSHSQLNPQSHRKNQKFCESKYRNSKILYVQAYNHEIPFKVYYDKSAIKSKFDNIIAQYLDEQVENFSFQKSYTINEQFWQWIFTQYGQNIFAYFITEFYCRAYNFFSKNTIHKAIFYWVFEKPKSEFGDNTKVTQELGKHKQMLEAQYLIQKSKKLSFKVKLVNVKNAEIQFYKNILTFQQEYQEIILNRIKTSSSDPQKSSLGQRKNYVYQSRLNTLHSKVRDLFLKEQNKVLNQVETEKQYEGKQDSNKLARLLLPGMKEEQTIREILNDEFAFQKLILFQQKKVEKERLRRAKQKLLTETSDKSNSKHIYQQSRIRKKNFSSRKIRIKTQC